MPSVFTQPLLSSVSTRLARTFTALSYPNYRLWFFGQLISLTGTGAQTAAQGFFLYQLTDSPVYLGWLGFASGAPAWLFTLYAGVIADRLPRRTLMVIAQSVQMVIAFITAWLVFSDYIQPWHILILSALTGTASAFEAPVRQAFVADMVAQKDLTNAIALNATMFNSAVVIGPAIGGLIYAAYGPGWCFIINAFSFLAVIVALLMMNLVSHRPQAVRKSVFGDVREGFRYIFRERTIQVLILGLAAASLFGFGTMSIMPAWAVDVLGGDVRTNSLLLAARGIGAVIGALTAAALSYRRVKSKLWILGSLITPLALLVFGLARWVPLSLIALAAFGLGQMIFLNTTNALVQNHVTNELRGRVMSLYTLVLFGSLPLGSLLAGNLAQSFSEPVAVFTGAVCLLAFSLFARRFRSPVNDLEPS